MSGGPEIGRALGDAVLLLACLAIVAVGAMVGGFWWVAFGLWSMIFPISFNPAWCFITIPLSMIVSCVFWFREKD